MPRGFTFKKLSAALLIAVVVWAFYAFILTDERSVIQKKLDQLAAAASFEGEIHPFEQLAYAKQVASSFDERVKLMLLDQDGARPAIEGREDLREKLLIVRRILDQLAVSISKVEIRVQGDVASVTAHGRAMGREPGRQDYFLEQHEISLTLEKTGGSWLITQGQNLDPIETIYRE